MDLVLRHVRQLVTVERTGAPLKQGSSMRDIGVIEDASVVVEKGRISWVGPTAQEPRSLPPTVDVLDGSSSVVLPGFVDAHTHLVFAGSREKEFSMRSEGMSYQEIAQRGGGILNTVTPTRQATKRDLKKRASRYLDAMMKAGTTTVEIKSGYGLTPDDEVKLLEVINELGQEHFMNVVPTFLGAHAVPPEFKEQPEDYVALVIDTMLPYVGRRRLAEFCDVFCEKGYFSAEQSRRILLRGLELGLKPKIHADELSPSGGSSLAGELRAVSADHLEHIDDEGIAALRDQKVVGVLLPGVSFFLNHPYAPARRLIDAGVPIALATDFNPGSCMSFSMPLMMTIACTQMQMTPEEAVTACTLNAAAALGRSASLGSIEVGKQADLIVYDVPHYSFLAYHFGSNHVARVIKDGTILEF